MGVLVLGLHKSASTETKCRMNLPVLNVLDSLLSVIVIICLHCAIHIRQFNLSSKIHIDS